jgi:protein arginine kinase activator
MICQQCNAKSATVHFMKIVNGEKTESHLCEACAKQHGEPFAGFIPPSFSVHDLLSGMIGQAPQPAETRCENCGLTYVQFSKQGRFGCSQCYSQFAGKLDSVFKRVHGHTSHVGKVPKRAGGPIQIRREREDLQRQLQQHISKQEFEQAAAVRDRLKELGDAP